jgi:hypothetical protein
MIKKEALMLGLLAVGGVGTALMLSGTGEGIGAGGGGLGLGKDEKEPEAMTKKETVTETYTPTGAPTIEMPRGFFDIPDIFVQKFAALTEPKKYPVFTGKIIGSAGTALGYRGYVTPAKPTPTSPGYVPGVTKFMAYTKPSYIPSPIKPPSVSYAGRATSKKSTFRTGKRYTSVTGRYSGR